MNEVKDNVKKTRELLATLKEQVNKELGKSHEKNQGELDALLIKKLSIDFSQKLLKMTDDEIDESPGSKSGDESDILIESFIEESDLEENISEESYLEESILSIKLILEDKMFYIGVCFEKENDVLDWDKESTTLLKDSEKRIEIIEVLLSDKVQKEIKTEILYLI